MILQSNSTEFFALGLDYPDALGILSFAGEKEEKLFWNVWELKLYDMKITSLANEYIQTYWSIPIRLMGIDSLNCTGVDHASAQVSVHYNSRLEFSLDIPDSLVEGIPDRINSLGEENLFKYSEFLIEHCSYKEGYAPYAKATPTEAAESIRIKDYRWEADASVFFLWLFSLFEPLEVSWKDFVRAKLKNCDPHQFTTAEAYIKAHEDEYYNGEIV